MSLSAWRALALGIIGLTAIGSCAHRSGGNHTLASAGPSCPALVHLAPLESALISDLGSTGAAGRLAAMDALLGAAEASQKALSAMRTQHVQTTQLDALLAHVAALREPFAQSLTTTQLTHEAAREVLAKAGFCNDVDLRRADELPLHKRPSKDDEAAREQARLATLRAPKCESAVRLWQAVDDIELTSALSVGNITAQLSELRLGPVEVDIRTQLIDALHAHKGELDQLEALTKGDGTHAFDSAPEDRLRLLALAELSAFELRCLSNMPRRPSMTRAKGNPRAATMVVRPKWSGPAENFVHGWGFGSGFFVQWPLSSGGSQTLVVTNHHVMQGAHEADLMFDVSVSQARENGQPKTFRANVLWDDTTADIAVLQLATAVPKTGSLPFRLTPARERETIVAAGFPGVGAAPSFQVTEGVVSNATFGASQSDTKGVSGYVQHTAPIDPGNSGGPLLDARGALLGMNTLKIVNRENVGLAIPTPRIVLALMRAQTTPVFNLQLARAACHAAVAALASPQPNMLAVNTFGVALYTPLLADMEAAETATFAAAVEGANQDPISAMRARMFGAARLRVEREGGVSPYATCQDVRALAGNHRFSATFRTRTATHHIELAPEGTQLRVVALQQ